MTVPFVSIPSLSSGMLSAHKTGDANAIDGNIPSQFLDIVHSLYAGKTQGNNALSSAQIDLGNGSKAHLFSLSGQDLKNLLDPAQPNGLPKDILMALTNGIPVGLLPETGLSDFSPLSLDDLTKLVSSHGESLSKGNILLVASNVSPSDIESLVHSISLALSQSHNDAQINADLLTKTDEKSTLDLQFVLVTLSSDEMSSDMVSLLEHENDTTQDPSVNWYVFSNILAQNKIQKTLNDEASLHSSTLNAAAEKALASAPPAVSPFAARTNSFANQNTDMATPFQFSNSTADSSPTQNSLASSTSFSLNNSLEQSAAARFLDSSKGWANGKITTDTMGMMQTYIMSGDTLLSGKELMGNPALTNPSATAAHPASQTLMAVLEKFSQNGEVKSQTLSVELDPPELGRVQVHLSYEKGEPMKVRLVTENEDTLSILRRDSHALRQALEAAGVQTGDSSLNFDMSQDSNAFQQALNHQNDQQQGHSSSRSFRLDSQGHVIDTSSLHNDGLIETNLGIITDEVTGQIHYNLLA